MTGTWKDLFSFNKRERNGIFVLTVFIVLTICVQMALPFMTPDPPLINEQELNAIVQRIKDDSVLLANKKKIEKQKQKPNKQFNKKGKRTEVQRVWRPKKIDPNLSNVNDWMNFGLSQKQAASILKYITKGGVFKVKTDVEKMYVITPELYQRIQSYLMLPDTIQKKAVKWNEDKERKGKLVLDTFRVNLNTADTTQLKQIRGIGSYYAKQIIRYRERLGGYYSVNQLYEIERMREETVLKIIPFLIVDSSEVIKIRVNQELASVMVKHPYITWNMAIRIQDYRDFTKKFKSTHQLVEIGLLNEEIYSKLVPYLEL